MKTEVNAVMLFIAELTGSFVPGSGGADTKIKCGQENYINNYLHVLDLGEEDARKELHENMWLERLYNELDQYFDINVPSEGKRRLALESERYRDYSYKWTVPIELDASSLT